MCVCVYLQKEVVSIGVGQPKVALSHCWLLMRCEALVVIIFCVLTKLSITS